MEQLSPGAENESKYHVLFMSYKKMKQLPGTFTKTEDLLCDFITVTGF